MSNPVDKDDELERKLIDLFAKCTSFGFSFGHNTSKEEFAEMLSNGESKDHQEAAHEAMQLIKQRDEQVARENQTLRAHLAYVAGEYEGITGHKSAYLLKNWPEYEQLATNHKAGDDE